MNEIVSRLVRDKDTGKLCVQCCLNSDTATVELPDDLGAEDLKAYLNEVVPQIISGLWDRQREGHRKLKRKVDNA